MAKDISEAAGEAALTRAGVKGAAYRTPTASRQRADCRRHRCRCGFTGAERLVLGLPIMSSCSTGASRNVKIG
jgi:hypothetical protein